MANFNYKDFFADNFQIVNKRSERVPLRLNGVQERFLRECQAHTHNKNIVLKARQQGFSAVIDACMAAKMLLKPNYRGIIVAHRQEAAAGLLARLKFYISSYESRNHVIIPKDRNSVRELSNSQLNSSILIGTAINVDVGRSRTYDEAHLSEYAFYPHGEQILNSVVQAVVPGGTVNIETTANGFNFFKTLWDETNLGVKPYNPMFFPASEFYSPEFLAEKKRELGRFFSQEYPETPEEAFLASGETYFDKSALKYYLDNAKEWKEPNV